MQASDESILICDLKKGNVEAFKKIYSFYHKRIYNFCLSLHQSADEAEETVQKVFVALWEQRLQVDEEKSLATYLYSIARYMVYRDFRLQVYKKAALDNINLKLNNINVSTIDDVLYSELVAFLEKFIEEIPERQREVFKLSRFSGLTYIQIADRLNISENTVDTQIRKALVFLRLKYKQHYI